MINKSTDSKVELTKIDYKLKNAITKLTSLQAITINKKLTSHYSYGINSDSCIRDRFDITIQLKPFEDIQCQIIFDSNNYDFPPDIIFKKSFFATNTDLIKLLPSKDWNIDNEDCLYDWFKSILNIIKMYEKDTTIFEKNDKRKTWDLFENTKRKNDEDSVDLEDPFKPYPIFNKNSSPILQQKKRIKQSNSDNDFKLFDLTASSKNKPQITKEELEKQILWRKEFMTSWIKMYKNHIVQYDARNCESFALYLNFNIPESNNDSWEQYKKQKQKSLENFDAINKIPKAKPNAPMLINFKLNSSDSILEIQLISVMNTKEIGSSEPDLITIDFKTDTSKSISSQIDYIKSIIRKAAIRFHLFQEE